MMSSVVSRVSTNMELAHLVPTDDLYSGYNECPAALNTKDLEKDEGFVQAIKTGYGRRPLATAGMPKTPGTAMRLGTSSGFHAGGIALRTSMGTRGGTAMRASMGTRGGTGMQMTMNNVNRPMTAVRAAGYTSSKETVDPLKQSHKGPAPPLEVKKQDSPEEKVKQVERNVNILIEASCLANSRHEYREALEYAKQASAKEKSLIRMREQAGLKESHNLDLTFNVLFNLANQYAANEMHTESLNTYQVITKNRLFTNSGRLKMNMANIYFHLGQYGKAIKFYRMALDQVGNTHKDLRIKIMYNIGILFVKMGHYGDACTSFEYIMQEKPDFKSGLHLVLCYYSVGDPDKMRHAFELLLTVPPILQDEDKYAADDPMQRLEVIRNDSLRRLERKRCQEAEYCILMAAKLISPVIDDSLADGYGWCVDTVRASLFSDFTNELVMNKAVAHLKQREFQYAIEALRDFEKKGTKVASTAAANLSFLYFLQGDLNQAQTYGQQARNADSYNAGAFVNLGNVFYTKGDVEKAKELFTYALENDSSCVEALYNLALCEKKLGYLDSALSSFMKLQSIIRNYPEAIYQVGSIYELMNDVELATEHYFQLLTLVPSDPCVLRKMGQIFDAEGDKQQAYQYHFDSFRYQPSNLEVIDWLGAYFLEIQLPEKASTYFERAALIQPDEPRWQLLVASCQRRSGNYNQALSIYKQVHRRFPENIDCLKFLVRLTTDLGLKEATEYTQELKLVMKAKEVRERAGSSRPGSFRAGSRRSVSAISADSGLDIRSQTGSALQGPRSTPGSAFNGMSGRQSKISLIESVDNEEPEVMFKKKEIDVSYNDPIGPLAERPRTSSNRKAPVEDDFGDEELGDDLLPL